MERLHARLYEKYRKLKKRRLLEASECSGKAQGEFEKYLTVVESMIEDLKSENSKLRQEISSLKKTQLGYRQNLAEEHRKVEELSNEVERLRSTASAEPQSDDILALVTPLNVAKDQRFDSDGQRQSNFDSSLPAPQPETTESVWQDNLHNKQPSPDCSGRKSSDSGDEKEKDHARCIYQMLIESLVGMKFSVEGRADDMHLSLTHQSSGYSFTLTWLRKGEDDEGELLYRVLSLGTIENVAVEWMKDDLIFSTVMCRPFFNRISRVLGPYA